MEWDGTKRQLTGFVRFIMSDHILTPKEQRECEARTKMMEVIAAILSGKKKVVFTPVENKFSRYGWIAEIVDGR